MRSATIVAMPNTAPCGSPERKRSSSMVPWLGLSPVQVLAIISTAASSNRIRFGGHCATPSANSGAPAHTPNA